MRSWNLLIEKCCNFWLSKSFFAVFLVLVIFTNLFLGVLNVVNFFYFVFSAREMRILLSLISFLLIDNREKQINSWLVTREKIKMTKICFFGHLLYFLKISDFFRKTSKIRHTFEDFGHQKVCLKLGNRGIYFFSISDQNSF